MWSECLDYGSPSSTKYVGKPLAKDTSDMALVRASSGAQQQVHEGQPCGAFFFF